MRKQGTIIAQKCLDLKLTYQYIEVETYRVDFRLIKICSNQNLSGL